MKKTTRVLIAENTLFLLDQGHYTNRQGQTIHVQEAQQASLRQTQYYTEASHDAFAAQLADILSSTPTARTTFEVTGETTLEAAHRLATEGVKHVVALNFASAKNPGGGFLNGSQAQEESLARASGLYPTLLQQPDFYKTHRTLDTCLYTDAMIYSPEVPVLKDDDGNLLDNYYTTSILTSPAVNAGAVQRNEPQRVTDIAPYMLRRTERVLGVALLHAHKTLILGAWGCGVFQNDPAEVAAWFAKHLRDGRYANRFERIVFAIKASDDRFILPFRQHFG